MKQARRKLIQPNIGHLDQRGEALALLAPIVVATDLSPTSNQALAAADVRSRGSGAPLIVCHVLPADRSPCAPLFPQDRDLFVNMMDRAEAQRAVLAQVRAATGRSQDRYATHIGQGLVSRAIAELAEESLAGLIVVGHGSAGRRSHAVRGGTSDQLARLSRSSLLVVRDGRRRGVVVARDGASSHAARIAKAEAATRDVELVASGDDPVVTATDRFASLIVIDDASQYDDPADVVRRAPCSVLVIRGKVTF